MGLTPTGYAGEAVVATARAATGFDVVDAGVTRAELAQVQRDLFGARTAVISAAVAPDGATSPDAEQQVAARASTVARIDELVTHLHGLLKRPRSRSPGDDGEHHDQHLLAALAMAAVGGLHELQPQVARRRLLVARLASLLEQPVVAGVSPPHRPV